MSKLGKSEIVANTFWFFALRKLDMKKKCFTMHFLELFNGSQLAKMKKYIPYMSLP